MPRSTPSAAEPYSPQRRTAIALTGAGTDGAYHAGVLRALDEAGVKLDVVAGRGVGVVSALFSAVDGGQRLWDEKGFWRSSAVRGFYGWHRSLRLVITALALAALVVVAPLIAVAVGLVVFPIDFLLKILGLSAANGLVASYVALAERAFAPEGLPTWLPRIAMLILAMTAAVLIGHAFVTAGARRLRGGFWWRLLPPPLSTDSILTSSLSALWDLMRGAAPLGRPDPQELGRRYAEMLEENIGQLGFRELLVTVHDVDAHRDLIGALVAPARRRDLLRRATSREADARQAEVLDLAGTGRDYVADLMAAALSVPMATALHSIRFAPEDYWRGEEHRVCDRPGGLIRLVDELAALEVEQLILVSGASSLEGPHTLLPARVDGKGKLGEYLRASEAAAVQDAANGAASRGLRVFTVRPGYNAMNPFDFDGSYDDRSDRHQSIAELLSRGYEDAYRQFIDPVVAVSGESLKLEVKS